MKKDEVFFKSIVTSEDGNHVSGFVVADGQSFFFNAERGKYGNVDWADDEDHSFRGREHAKAVSAVNRWYGEKAARKLSEEELSAVRRAAAAKAMTARWGCPRGKSKQVRVSPDAFNALRTVPEKERNDLASRAIIEAVDQRRTMTVQ